MIIRLLRAKVDNAIIVNLTPFLMREETEDSGPDCITVRLLKNKLTRLLTENMKCLLEFQGNGRGRQVIISRIKSDNGNLVLLFKPF